MASPSLPCLRPELAIALALAFCGLDPRPVQAHAIESSLERLQSLNQQLQLESRFSTGVPVDDAAVRLVPPGGGEGVLVGRTDGRGQLRFSLPQGVDQAWEVQVDGGAGHRDYLELPASGASPAATAKPSRRPSKAGPEAPLLAAGLLGLVGLVGSSLIRRR